MASLTTHHQTARRSEASNGAGFTAVNGRESPTQLRSAAGTPVNSNSNSNSNGNGDGNQQPPSPPSGTGHQSAKEHAILAAQRADWERSRSSNEMRPPSPGGAGQPQAQMHPLTSPGKRKRADSNDPAMDQLASYSSAAPSLGTQPHDQYPNPNQPDGGDHLWYGQRRAATPNSDAQLAEALQRDSAMINERERALSGPIDPEFDQDPSPDYARDRMSSMGIEIDHKRRKRQFSNRTKTGCLTCRGRKKKCDEAKPECNNCNRGGFICKGYSAKNVFPKPSSHHKAPFFPIQPQRDGDFTLPPPNGPSYQGVSRDQYASAQPLGGRAYMEEDHDHPASERPTRNMWAHRTVTPIHPPPQDPALEFSRPQQAMTDRNRISERDLPPPGSLTPGGGGSAQARTPQGSISMQNSQGRNASHPPSNQSYNSAHTTPTLQPARAATQSQNLALAALQHTGSASAPKTEKEKMLSMGHYLIFSPELVDERERCKAALWRFNRASDPSAGVSHEERMRLFRAAVQADTPSTPQNPTGTVGECVSVEAPFTCDYGYNINIGDHVVISSNCTILDPCRITIGNKCIIGPNVQIYGSTVSNDPRRRNGSQGPAIGRPIVIEDDCFIGGGATILPGIRVGKGSTIGAGSVVTRDVPRFVICSGNPARVLRGIYANENNDRS